MEVFVPVTFTANSLPNQNYLINSHHQQGSAFQLHPNPHKFSSIFQSKCSVNNHQTIKAKPQILETQHDINEPSQNCTQSLLFCRICLEESFEIQQHETNELDGKTLISPCSCTSYIHKGCLLEWLLHREELEEIRENKRIACQICQSAYQIRIGVELYYDCGVLVVEFGKNSWNVLKMVAMLLVVATILGLLLGVIIYAESTYKEESWFKASFDVPKGTFYLVDIIFILIFAMLLLGIGNRFLSDYFINCRYLLQTTQFNNP